MRRLAQLIFFTPFVLIAFVFGCGGEKSDSNSANQSSTVAPNGSTASLNSCGATGSGVCRYVTSNGATSGACSIESPCTLQRAAAIVNPGDVVLAADGIYTSTSQYLLTISRGGNATNKVVFKSINRRGARLDGENYARYAGLRVEASYVRFEGFDIGGFADMGIYNVSGSFFELVGNHIHHIGRGVCTFTDIGLDGYYSQGTTDILIEGNQFNDIGRLRLNENGCTTSRPNNDHGLYMSGTRIMVRNNIFFNINEGWPIHFYPGSSDSVWIYGNTLAGHIVQNSSSGQILIWPTCTNVHINNNIFYQTQGHLIHVGSSSITGEVKNNLTDGDVGIFDMAEPGVVTSGNLFKKNPVFFDVSSSGGIISGIPDFHLKSTSPAIDAGLNLGASDPFDFDGIMRPQGAGFDIGAFEFVPSPRVPDPLTSTISPGVILTGTVQGVPDPKGSFSIQVKDSLAHPILNARVDLDLSACSYANICSSTVGLHCSDGFDPLRPNARIVSGVTDSSGNLQLDIAGSLVSAGMGMTGGACAELRVGGVSFPNQVVSVLDLDASGEDLRGYALDPNDLSVLLNDYLVSGQYRPRSDFVGDGKLDPNDLSKFLEYWLQGIAVSGCRTTSCGPSL